MKTLLKTTLVLLLCVMTTSIANARDVKKTIHKKNYPFSGAITINLNTTLFDVEVISSPMQQQIEVRVEMEIDDDFRGNHQGVNFTGQVKDSFKNNILDVLVSQDKNTKNQYGDDVEFKCYIMVPANAVSLLNIVSSYSDVEIEGSIVKGVVKADYSNIEFHRVKEVDFSGANVEFKVENVEKATISAKYAEVEIENLTQEMIVVDLQYSNLEVECLRGVKLLDLQKVSYVEVDVEFRGWQPNIVMNNNSKYSHINNNVYPDANANKVQFNCNAQYSTINIR